jgi:hypothetical protein
MLPAELSQAHCFTPWPQANVLAGLAVQAAVDFDFSRHAYHLMLYLPAVVAVRNDYYRRACWEQVKLRVLRV